MVALGRSLSISGRDDSSLIMNPFCIALFSNGVMSLSLITISVVRWVRHLLLMCERIESKAAKGPAQSHTNWQNVKKLATYWHLTRLNE